MSAHLMTAADIGEMLGITARRVTQYRDDGLLPTPERGRFDISFLMYLRMGEQITRSKFKRPDRDTLVALGWLSGVDAEAPHFDQDLQEFGKLFQRNGLTQAHAHLALGRAQGMSNR